MVSARSVSFAAMAIAMLAVTTHADAADPQATKLFNQGVKLFERGETKAACDKFRESYEIDPAPGTLFNLASCREKLGEFSRAHHDYVELARRADAANKPDRAATFRASAAALESHLPTLVLVWPATRSGTDDTSSISEIKIDDDALPKERWSGPIPIEDGKHKLTFTSTSDVKDVSVVVPHEGSIRVETPVIAITQPAEPPPAPPQVAPPPKSAPADTTVRVTTTHSPASYVLAGAGVIAIGVGSYFGIAAFGDKRDATSQCPNHVCPTIAVANQANASRSSLSSDATASTVLFAIGAGLVAGGVVTYVLTSHTREVAIAPAIDPRYGGAVLRGTF